MKSLRGELDWIIYTKTDAKRRTFDELLIDSRLRALRDTCIRIEYINGNFTPLGQMFIYIPNNFLLNSVSKV